MGDPVLRRAVVLTSRHPGIQAETRFSETPSNLRPESMPPRGAPFPAPAK
ncbi:hypothetical protein SAMN04488042_10677 [Shimia aestuarii]|uniref:Uncharacterized protein n=1 Tax=Shimia aestuarii TaxID=254406 RepID=A0A1I4PWJ9_9RHOB|nr:hypothetical protein SAMN04488042_10677 [Shimia aestuarii]